MSFKYYVNWWITNKRSLEKLTAADEQLLKMPQKVNDRYLANKLVGGLYAKYCMLVQELDLCLDQLAQPQKTWAVRKLVESAILRLKELFDELKWINFSEYHYIDDSLIELKIIPHDIEILHPYLSYPRPYDIQQMYERLKNGERIYSPPPQEPEPTNETTTIDDTASAALVEEGPETKKEKKKKKTRMQTPIVLDKKEEQTPEEIEHERQVSRITDAVNLIINQERARQARLYHYEINRNFRKHLSESNKTKGEESTEVNQEETEEATKTLQKCYRGHFCRKFLKHREDERRLLIGMTEGSYRTRKEFEKEEKCIEERRKLRELRVKEYIEANLAEKDRVLRVIGPGLMEDIGDEIREWFHQWYVIARNFDKYPPEQKGGTILVVRGETLTPQEWIDQVEKRRRDKVKAGGKKALQAKLKAEKAKQKLAEKKAKAQQKLALKKAMREKKKRRRDVKNYELEFDDPKGKALYKSGQDEHEKLWNFRDEMLNPEETHYMDLITDERCYELQLEMRKIVDEMMRLELELLMAALAKDKGKKPKASKKKKKKKKRKGKKGKRHPKDITSHRTTEDIFQELVDNGIIRLYPKTRLDEFIGDMSYKNMELRYNEHLSPPPCLGDVRQVIAVNCILPLGLATCKGRSRSLIICGPPQSGKRVLANAIFTATRCVLFDLSVPVLAGKYPGKEGLQMLIHLVMKMARLLQPSILYLDGAERVFYKRIPQDEIDMEPKRLGKVLMRKMIKTIKADDRVMLVGITNRPWAAGGKMKKVFDTAILVPRSDYGSLYLYWRELLMRYHGVDRDMDLSCLAKLTVNYPLGVIKQVIEQVMTPSRITQMHFKPLTQQELFEFVLKKEPVTDKIWKKYLKWYARTAVGKLEKKFAKYNAKKRQELLKQREAEISKKMKAADRGRKR